jgi:protocatechuate 3,4-dioxygenase beta subunit
MDTRMPTRQNRRAFLRACLAMPAMYILAGCAGEAATMPPPTAAEPVEEPAAATQVAAATEAPAPTQPPAAEPPATEPAATKVAQTLAPTPACDDGDDDITPAQTEGPYYTPNPPERTSLLEEGIGGTPLAVAGLVLTTGCQPIARALLDFWHCDDSGEYDNAGYRLRGHQFTDDQGRYTLETILPGVYPGRTRHIHVKVQAPNQPVLTTQLYFPDEPGNASDGIFQQELVMDVQDSGGGKAATFDFVLDIA